MIEGDKMRGYKGTKADMTCRGFQFELGKTYKVQGEIEMCKNGFHFCKTLGSVFEYYPPDDGNRFFEIEAKEPINREYAKYVTAEITFIRELSAKEVGRALYSDGTRYSLYEYGDGNGYSTICVDGCGYGNGSNYGIKNGDYGNGDGDYGNGEGGGYGNSDGTYGGIKGNIHKVLIFKEE